MDYVCNSSAVGTETGRLPELASQAVWPAGELQISERFVSKRIVEYDRGSH